MAEGFEGLVIQNLNHLNETIDHVRDTQELMQIDLNAIKVDMATQKQQQNEVIGPLKNWRLDDSVVLWRVIEKERKQDSAADDRDRKTAERTKLVQGWRDRLLLVTAAFAVFNSLIGGALHVAIDAVKKFLA